MPTDAKSPKKLLPYGRTALCVSRSLPTVC